MIDDKTLRTFCERDGRKELESPFNIGDHTYATNGHFAVRVAIRPEYKTAEIKIQHMFPHANIPADKYIDLPAVVSPEEQIICTDCKGSGEDIECTDCDGTGEVSWMSPGGYNYEEDCQMCRSRGVIKGPCEKCGATGKTAKDKQIDVGSKLLSGRMLAIIAGTLKNVKIAPDAVPDLSPVPFIFDGGEGIIMPLRKMSPL